MWTPGSQIYKLLITQYYCGSSQLALSNVFGVMTFRMFTEGFHLLCVIQLSL